MPGAPSPWPYNDKRFPEYQGFRGGGPFVKCGNCGGMGTTSATNSSRTADYTCSVCGGSGRIPSTFGRTTEGSGA